MSRRIILIGGPKHGDTIELPDEINFKNVDTRKGDDNSTLYTICQTGDGHFYGVYEPLNDPSVQRIQSLRDQIYGALR
jgi:hypothetical protein